MGSSSSSARQDPGLGDLAVAVAGGRDGAEPRPHAVGLRQLHEPALLAGRRAAEEHDQAGPVANGSSVPAWPVLAPKARRARATDVVRGDARRLVDEETHRRPRAARPPSAELSGDLGTQELDQLGVRAGRCRSRPRGGARRRPGARAIAETSTAPSVERRLTLRAERPPSVLSRTTAATAVPSSAADEVDDPLGEHLPGAGRGVVLGADVGDREPVVVEALRPSPAPARSGAASRSAPARRGAGRCR